MDVPSLTRIEAQQRAAVLSVERYEVAVDLTGLLDGDALWATATIRFGCSEPGATTFVECAAEVESAVLNGVPIQGAAGPRVTLEGLAADNVLVVRSVQRATSVRTGVHRSVDQSDGAVYVWTSFEPDEAHRVWACFDQPDLKAVFALTVDAPADWTVLTSTANPVVTDVGAARRWAFPDTPRLSTYVPALNAGPFHEVRREVAGFDLGLLCRRSLAANLDRDVQELFDVTAAGLTFFGEQFALPFPQRRYDQVFLPDFGGAMENYGCVSWSDAFVYRTPPSHGEREIRVLVLLHEMAHMWFGDMVTMRWWDDLWLNEAFAEWACHWAAAAVTPYRDVWASFLAGWKLGGYRADRAPSTHPIRQQLADVATAAANFDSITYAKGAAVLKQLVAWVGQDAFVAGLRSYFSANSWANATLDDLVGEIAAAGRRDVAGWTRAWLESSGTDTLTVTDGVLHAAGPDGAPPRPHRLDLGVYDRDGAGALVRRELVPLELSSTEVRLPALAPAALLLVNDEDLTFAVVRPDAAGIAALLSSAADLPSAISRTVAVTTAWQLVVLGEVPAASFVRCATAVLARETNDAVIEPLLRLAVEAAESWVGDDGRDELLTQLADACIALAGTAGTRVVATRSLARTAVTGSQLARLAELVEDDIGLQWRRLTRLAALGRLDPAELAALQARDPDPEAWAQALVVRAAQPQAQAKQEAWDAVLDAKVPLGSTNELATAFWQPAQADVLAPFGQRYLDELPTMGAGGMIPAMVASGALFPSAGVDAGYLDRLAVAAADASVNPVVTRTVVERSDELRRMLAARSRPTDVPGQAG